MVSVWLGFDFVLVMCFEFVAHNSTDFYHHHPYLFKTPVPVSKANKTLRVGELNIIGFHQLHNIKQWKLITKESVFGLGVSKVQMEILFFPYLCAAILSSRKNCTLQF